MFVLPDSFTQRETVLCLAWDSFRWKLQLATLMGSPSQLIQDIHKSLVIVLTANLTRSKNDLGRGAQWLSGLGWAVSVPVRDFLSWVIEMGRPILHFLGWVLSLIEGGCAQGRMLVFILPLL